MHLEAAEIRLLWAQNQLRAAILRDDISRHMTDASSVEPGTDDDTAGTGGMITATSSPWRPGRLSWAS